MDAKTGNVSGQHGRLKNGNVPGHHTCAKIGDGPGKKEFDTHNRRMGTRSHQDAYMGSDRLEWGAFRVHHRLLQQPPQPLCGVRMS